MTPEEADRAIDRILNAGWFLADGLGDCDQLVDGRWYRMAFGCDSLTQSLDVVKSLLLKAPPV